MKKSYFKMPNHIVMNSVLSYSARHLAVVLCSYQNENGECRKSLRQLSQLSGYSQTTIVKAMKELLDNGLISVKKSSCFREDLGMNGHDRNTYCLTMQTETKYTLVSRSVLHTGLKNCAMVMYLYLLVAAGNQKRAWPSINQIAKAIGASQSTVCRVLSTLKSVSGIHIENCVKKNRVYACNSYFLDVKHAKFVNLQQSNTQKENTFCSNYSEAPIAE